MAQSRKLLWLGLLVGLSPYFAGAVLAFSDLSIREIAVATVLVAALCSTAAYLMRRKIKSPYAKQRLIVDPFLDYIECLFMVVVIRYMFLQRRL
jgi:hypothetical protein